MKNLTLNNGQIAKYLHRDDWDRPVYELKNGIKVCCTELDGSYLHTISDWDEPISPLKKEYQPKESASDEQEELTVDLTHEYMLLGRLKSDLDYYFGHGNRSENALYFSNIDEQISEMKKKLNAFPEDRRPVWLTEDDIKAYESQLTAG